MSKLRVCDMCHKLGPDIVARARKTVRIGKIFSMNQHHIFRYDICGSCWFKLAKQFTSEEKKRNKA